MSSDLLIPKWPLSCTLATIRCRWPKSSITNLSVFAFLSSLSIVLGKQSSIFFIQIYNCFYSVIWLFIMQLTFFTISQYILKFYAHLKYEITSITIQCYVTLHIPLKTNTVNLLEEPPT